ncbi:hypothetical protein P030_03915 [Anaplasma phagocytophilum str. CRT35]|nr:hypothetical protein P030_03915 [Anaplasma phagocytophilum str. CRT35]
MGFQKTSIASTCVECFQNIIRSTTTDRRILGSYRYYKSILAYSVFDMLRLVLDIVLMPGILQGIVLDLLFSPRFCC